MPRQKKEPAVKPATPRENDAREDDQKPVKPASEKPESATAENYDQYWSKR